MHMKPSTLYKSSEMLISLWQRNSLTAYVSSNQEQKVAKGKLTFSP